MYRGCPRMLFLCARGQLPYTIGVKHRANFGIDGLVNGVQIREKSFDNRSQAYASQEVVILLYSPRNTLHNITRPRLTNNHRTSSYDRTKFCTGRYIGHLELRRSQLFGGFLGSKCPARPQLEVEWEPVKRRLTNEGPRDYITLTLRTVGTLQRETSCCR